MGATHGRGAKLLTHTGLLLNFDALCPLKWKSGLILCLLNPAKDVC